MNGIDKCGLRHRFPKSKSPVNKISTESNDLSTVSDRRPCFRKIMLKHLDGFILPPEDLNKKFQIITIIFTITSGLILTGK